LYRLAEAHLRETASLAEISERVPTGVLCLLTALAYHDMTTQNPHEVWIAVGQKAWAPTGLPAKVRLIRMSDPWLVDGVETHEIDGTILRVTSPLRTTIDCFKMRNTVGLDVALEALRELLDKRLATPSQIAEMARRRRVLSVVRPYVEALVA
jgi:predicted transcriptional regulator of viral defense system